MNTNHGFSFVCQILSRQSNFFEQGMLTTLKKINATISAVQLQDNDSQEHYVLAIVIHF